MKHYDYFSDKSDIYAKSRPLYPNDLFYYLSSVSPRRELAWDCGCGNGQAAIGIAEYFENVEASDVSAEQIAQAKLRDNVHYFVSPAENTSLKDTSIDLITVAQALHWFDSDKYWIEVDRVLKPKGIFAAFGYSWFNINSGIDELIQMLILDVIYDYWAPQNRLLWNQYRDIKFPYEKINSPNFLLNFDWNLYELFGYIHSWSATRRCMEKEGEEFFRKAFERINVVWGDPIEIKHVKMDFCLIVGMKT
jgi:SAM-dependent methyltransferase